MNPITPAPTPSSAATGALLGLALGDALGWPTEFLSAEAIADRFGPWRGLPLPTPAVVTDDTQMTLAVARALDSTCTGSGPLDPDAFAAALRREFISWSRSPENTRAPGATCMTACRLLEDERAWQQASQTHSKGCGANMRVAPLGLHPVLDEEERAGGAQLQAALTHGHPTALAASDLTARAVHLLSLGAAPTALVGELRTYAASNRTWYHYRWLGDLWSLCGDTSPEAYIARGWDECLQILDRLEAALAAADEEADPCDATGEGWIAEEALATSLLAFLQHPADPVTALRRAAATRGDSDSLAALAGAFAGAHLGTSAWPPEWTGRLEYREDLLAHGAAWDR